MSSSVPVRIGIVGAGHAATKGHLPVLTKLPGVELVLCEMDTVKANRVAQQFGIRKVYHSYTEMLDKEKLELVDVVTSSDTHVALAIQAMEHGCNCIMEKPLSVTTVDADKAIRKANETGLGLFVIQNWSFLPALRRAKSIVSSGYLGQVVEVDVRYMTSFGAERYLDPSHWCHRLPGGIFADISPHLAMVLLDFLMDVTDVKAMTRKVSEYSYIAADELKVMIKAGNGLGSFTLSFNSPAKQFAVEITGTKMSLTVDANTQTVVAQRPVAGDKPIRSALQGIPRGLSELDKILQRIGGLASMTAGVMLRKRDALDGHTYLIRSAIDNIRNATPYPIDNYQCREVVRILEEAFNSSERGS